MSQMGAQTRISLHIDIQPSIYTDIRQIRRYSTCSYVSLSLIVSI